MSYFCVPFRSKKKEESLFILAAVAFYALLYMYDTQREEEHKYSSSTIKGCPGLSIDMRCDEIEVPTVRGILRSHLQFVASAGFVNARSLSSVHPCFCSCETICSRRLTRSWQRSMLLAFSTALHIVLLMDIFKSRYTLGDNRQICRCMLSYVGIQHENSLSNGGKYVLKYRWTDVTAREKSYRECWTTKNMTRIWEKHIDRFS